MTTRARTLIEILRLQPHPEGGHYREVFRSRRIVTEAGPSQRRRAALTTIYFLLTAGQHSRWHRVGSDEAWHWYEGDPLELLWVSGDTPPHVTRTRLGVAGPSSEPVAVVPAGCWQAARSMGAYTLVGCSVGPGFDFADFELLGPGPERDRIRGSVEQAREFE